MFEREKSTNHEFLEKLNATIESCIEKRLKRADQIKRDIHVHELASALFMSVATLRRQCHTYTGKSPSTYLAEYRIEKAKRLLLQGFRSIDTSNAIAFSEHKTFCTVFKRYENKTPSQYIQGHRE